jgi:hypothetical protein
MLCEGSPPTYLYISLTMGLPESKRGIGLRLESMLGQEEGYFVYAQSCIVRMPNKNQLRRQPTNFTEEASHPLAQVNVESLSKRTIGPTLMVNKRQLVSDEVMCISKSAHNQRMFFGILASPDVELKDIWDQGGTRLVSMSGKPSRVDIQ